MNNKRDRRKDMFSTSGPCGGSENKETIIKKELSNQSSYIKKLSILAKKTMNQERSKITIDKSKVGTIKIQSDDKILAASTLGLKKEASSTLQNIHDKNWRLFS